MKIAVLSSHTPSLFWFRIDMMQSFIDRGHEVFALGNEAEDDWKERFADKGIIYRQINVQRNGTNPLKDLKSIKSIKTILKEIMPDKIFTYQAKTIIYGTIAANKLGITEVYPLIAGLGSLFLNDSLKTRLIRKILMTEYRYSMRKCKTVFFQNSDDDAAFRKAKAVNKQKTVLLHGSGVNLEWFTVQPMPDNFAFLCISRLIRDKGVFEYLKACAEIKKNNPDVRCMLVGPYDSNPSSLKPEELQKYIDSGVIEYFGEQSDVVPYLAQCSVFVLPSYREGTPKTVLEAMACGRAVITTDAPGCRETVDHNENGLLVPVKNVDELVKAMQFTIEHPDQLSKMAASGRKKVEEVFDVNKVNSSEFYMCDIESYCYRMVPSVSKYSLSKSYDLLCGINDNLDMSESAEMWKLHYLTAMRLYKDASFMAAKNINDENYPELLEKFIVTISKVNKKKLEEEGYNLPSPYLPEIFSYMRNATMKYEKIRKNKVVKMISRILKH